MVLDIDKLAVLLDQTYEDHHHIDIMRALRNFGSMYRTDLEEMIESGHKLEDLLAKAQIGDDYEGFICEGMKLSLEQEPSTLERRRVFDCPECNKVTSYCLHETTQKEGKWVLVWQCVKCGISRSECYAYGEKRILNSLSLLSHN